MSELRACCAEPGNREPHPDTRSDLKVERCAVCGLRHFELTVDPLHIAIREGVSA